MSRGWGCCRGGTISTAVDEEDTFGGVMDKSTLVTDRTDEGQSAGDTEPCCLGTGVKTQSRAAF